MLKNTATIDRIFNMFVKEKELYNLSASTLRSYRGSYRVMKERLSLTGKEDISILDRRFIVSYLEVLTDDNVSTSTINHYLRDLRAFSYWCGSEGYILPFRIKLIKEVPVPKDAYTNEEIKVLLRKPFPDSSYSEWRDWCIISLMMGTGIRASTAVNILTDDVDLKNSNLILRHNKNNTVDSIVLVPKLKKTMLDFSHQRDDGVDVFFYSKTREHLTGDSLAQSIRKYNRRRGINKTSVHLFRHAFGRIWAENGGDVFTLKKIFGHSKIQTTQGYVNLHGGKAEDARIIKLNPLETL